MMKNNQNGFSLIEILVSVTILAFITLGIASFTDGSITKAIRVTNEDIESLQIETAMSRMEWDISHLYSPLYFDHSMDPQSMTPTEGEIYNQLADYYQNNARFAFVTFMGLPVPIIKHPEKTELIIFTASNRRKVQNIKQSNFSWVMYQLQDEEYEEDEKKPEIKTFALTRKVQAQNVYAPEEIDWEDVKTQILMHKITTLKYEFWNPETNKWGDNLDVIKDGNHIIRGLRITMKYLDPSNIEVSTIRIFRPLYPRFKPENMYEFLKAKKNGGASGTTIGTGGAQGDDDDDDDSGGGGGTGTGGST